MKFLIYFLVFFAGTMIVALFRSNGVILGAIPTIAIYFVASLIGQALGKKWEDTHPKQ